MKTKRKKSTINKTHPLSIFISKNFEHVRSIIEKQEFGSIEDIEYYPYGVYVHFKSTTLKGELLRAKLNMPVKFSPEHHIKTSVDFVYGTAANGHKQVCKISPGYTPSQRKERARHLVNGFKDLFDSAKQLHKQLS